MGNDNKASLVEVKAYFGGEDGYRKLQNSEILELKREDPEGLAEIRRLVAEEIN